MEMNNRNETYAATAKRKDRRMVPLILVPVSQHWIRNVPACRLKYQPKSVREVKAGRNGHH